MGQQRRAIVLGGGPAGLDPGPLDIGPDDLVVAADSGLDHARSLGIPVDVLVGDLDSASEPALAAAADDGVPVERHPVDKDHTDLELALARALGAGVEEIVVVASASGRLDHVLATWAALAAPALAGVTVTAHVDGSTVSVVRGYRRLRGAPGDLVSLLALHGPAQGVRTAGLRYPLRGETLDAGSCRGISNVLTAAEAEVWVADGVVLAIQPAPG